MAEINPFAGIPLAEIRRFPLRRAVLVGDAPFDPDPCRRRELNQRPAPDLKDPAVRAALVFAQGLAAGGVPGARTESAADSIPATRSPP